MAKLDRYKTPEANAFYNLMFCDDLDAAHAMMPAPPADLMPLFDKKADERKLREISDDTGAASRIRALAFHRLRGANKKIAKPVMLGVVVEMPMDASQDTLAFYPDGSVRYINAEGKIAYVDGKAKPLMAAVNDALRVSQAVAQGMPASPHARTYVPPKGYARVTFLGSDGSRVLEGPVGLMLEDKEAGPVLGYSAALLKYFGDLAQTLDQMPSTNETPN